VLQITKWTPEAKIFIVVLVISHTYELNGPPVPPTYVLLAYASEEHVESQNILAASG
jgi:hypothetical protein